MEQKKKKKEEDVLIVRDEKTGEISVVAGLDSTGNPKRVPAKSEHSQDFLRFDRGGDMIDNFFKNFYRQCKEPSRFGFYRVAAETADMLIPVIKDLLKDPKANAELLQPHKVDTSAYGEAKAERVAEEAETGQAETKNKNTEELKKEDMEQKNKEQQPQQPAETQERQQQEQPAKPNLIADSDVNWEELKSFGVSRENLSDKDLKALMNYGKTGLVTVTPALGGDVYELQARLSFKKAEDGRLQLTPHFVRHEPKLDVGHNGYSFTDEDKKQLKQTGNLGKIVDVADARTGELRPSYISIDRLTNEIVDVPADKVRIPNNIGQTRLSPEEQQILRAGLALPKEITLANGRKFHALLQVNADRRDVEFVPGQPKQRQEQRNGNGQAQKPNGDADADSRKQQKAEGEGESKRNQRRSWQNEDGSIRPIGKWKDDKFTEQQKADYVAGKTVVLANAKDDKGQPCTMYLKFSHEHGRPLTYPKNPDLAQTVAPSNESRTQVAVNNEGKTNEATKNLKEPLQQGQTVPKDEAQQKRQEKPQKKSKGMKV